MIKPVFARILEGLDARAFATREIVRPIFSTEFHFHKACQMTYIVKSEGRRIIGDNVDHFGSDELTFLGSDLPHVWHNDKNSQELAGGARSLALYLDPTKILQTCDQLFDTKKLESFLHHAKRGLLFHGNTKKILKNKLRKIVEAEEIKKALLLFEIIDIVMHTNEFEYLSSAGYTHSYQSDDNDKIDRVFKHVFDHFSQEIQLNEIAEMSNMSKHAFCRYFKARTQKTFIQFVHEVRVSESCKLIIENKEQVSTIAYACGFNSLSNFNKIFKTIKGVTPSQYKEEVFGRNARGKRA